MPVTPYLLVAIAALIGGTVGAQPTPSPGPALSTALQDQTRTGTARMRYWGFDVYDAHLYVARGFDIQRFEEQRFGLELNYLRGFKGADIAERSLEEMKGLATLDPTQAQRWRNAMSALFPNVQSGDRLTGVHVPGSGARFYLNGQWLGEIADDTFSRLFFGIWLSPKTSQPRLREALIQSLGGPPRAP